MEHRLSRFLGHGHQAAVVLQDGQAFGVGPGRGSVPAGSAECFPVIDAGDPRHPFPVCLDGAARSHGVLHHHVTRRCDIGRGQEQIRIVRAAVQAILPFVPPVAKGWSEVPQPLEREEIGGERKDDGVGRNDCRPVDRAEVGADVDQHDVRLPCLGGLEDGAMEGRFDPKRRLVASHAVRPCRRKPCLEPGQPEVADDQTEVVRDPLDVRRPDVTESSKDRRNRSQDACGMIAVGP